MKEYILGIKNKEQRPLSAFAEGQIPSAGSELHQSDEIGKLYLQEISPETSHPLQGAGGLGLTTLLNVFPDKRVYAFHGQMGAGKTTFVKQLCEELGVTDIVNSPTFAIVNEYELPLQGAGELIYHFDCYRIKDLREAYDMGTEEYLYSGNYCFIEWPEMIEELLPEDTVHVTLTVNEDGTRTMRVEIL